MIELKNTTDIVKEVLETQPHTRNSDELLYISVCRKINPDVLKHDFEKVMQFRKEYGLPSIETVGRCRRKLQEKYSELQATDKVKDGRSENEEAFREFARNY